LNGKQTNVLRDIGVLIIRETDDEKRDGS